MRRNIVLVIFLTLFCLGVNAQENKGSDDARISSIASKMKVSEEKARAIAAALDFNKEEIAAVIAAKQGSPAEKLSRLQALETERSKRIAALASPAQLKLLGSAQTEALVLARREKASNAIKEQRERIILRAKLATGKDTTSRKNP
jgi:hypothetical protein